MPSSDIAILPAVHDFLNREQKLLIGGVWTAAASGETFATLNPATGQPLCAVAAGVWTNHLRRAHRMAAQLKAGVVWINAYDWFDPAVPFGGSGESGYGRELGTQVMDMYTELKSVWVKIQ